MKRLSLAIVVSALAGPVAAGGPNSVAPEASVAAAPEMSDSANWTGFYVGLSLLNGRFSDDGGSTDDGMDGFGAQAGYLRDFGRFVLGGELAHAKGDYDAFAAVWNSTRLKLIAGYDAGRFLPYAFVGRSRYTIPDDGDSPTDAVDTITIYGLGGKFAITQSINLGIEYLVEDKDSFAGDFDMESREFALRLDYRF
jgi:outer membrane immunogenic protein